MNTECHASADNATHSPGIVTGSHQPFEASLAELFGCVVLWADAIGDAA
jgi:hypothetical protein